MPFQKGHKGFRTKESYLKYNATPPSVKGLRWKVRPDAKKKLQLGEKNHMWGRKESKHHNWLGPAVGYRGLHIWVQNQLGKAKKCEDCGKEKTTPKSIHWANKSHQYLRELTDWISLCAKCHKQYDKNKHTS